MKLLNRLTLSVAIALSALSLSACQSLPDVSATSKSELRLFSNIHRQTLDNGLNIIIKEDRRAPVVMTQVWYGVGSDDEPVGKGGLSHFLEHLMFKDTPLVSGDEFSQLISHYGGRTNAYTNSDVTVYHEILPANRYTLALELEANRMTNVIFKNEQIDSERQVVQEERRVRTDDNPMAKAGEQVRHFIYGDTPRSRPVIGSMVDIGNLSMDDLQTWYRTWYTPNNATVVIVGDVDKDEAVANIKKYFGDIPKGKTPPKRNPSDFIHADDLYVGKGEISERHLDIYEAVQVPSVILAWQIPSISSLRLGGYDNEENRRELLALGLFSDVLSGGETARFAKNLVKTQKLNSAYAHATTPNYGDGLFTVSITPKAGDSPETAKRLVLDEIAHALHADISQKELDRSLVAFKTALIFASEGVSGQAQIFGQLHHQNISTDEVLHELDIMPTISADEIRQAGQKYLKSERMYSFYILPKATNDSDQP